MQSVNSSLVLRPFQTTGGLRFGTAGIRVLLLSWRRWRPCVISNIWGVELSIAQICGRGPSPFKPLER